MSRIAKLIDSVVEHYKIPRAIVFGGTRRDLASTAARAKIVYELRRGDKPLSFPQIGKILNLDHSSCIHVYKKMSVTNGEYYDDRLAKICRSTQNIHAKRNREFRLSKLKKAFENGIGPQQGA